MDSDIPYEIAVCFHLLLLSLLTVARFRFSVSPTKDNCPGVNKLEGDMLFVVLYLVPHSTTGYGNGLSFVLVREVLRNGEAASRVLGMGAAQTSAPSAHDRDLGGASQTEEREIEHVLKLQPARSRDA